jgi:hypothetical protein
MIDKRGGQDVAPLCAFSHERFGLGQTCQFPAARGPPLTQRTDELPRQTTTLGQAVGPR